MDNRCFINISCYIEVNTPSFSLKKLLIFVYSNLLKHECKNEKCIVCGSNCYFDDSYAATFICCSDRRTSTKRKTECAFSFVDDMTYDGLNVLGNSEIISPNLDKLVSSVSVFPIHI